jgi:signal peptidase I
MSVFIDLIGELLGCGHSVRFRANGKSMHPTIEDGEEIVVEPVAPSTVKVGDVLLYRSHRSVIAHRVVRIVTTLHPQSLSLDSPSSALSCHCSFILRGDNSDSCDDPVEAEQVLGKVVAIERDGHLIALDTWSAKVMQAVRAPAARLRRLLSHRLIPIG